MESRTLLPELQKLPAAEGAAALGHDEAVTRIRKMDRDHFAIEVSQATEEALEALFDWRNVPDVVNEAYRISFSSVAERHSLYERYQEVMEHGPGSVEGFVSKLKGTVAELQTKDLLQDQVPGSRFELPDSPTQPIWDGIWRLPDGSDVRVQIKTGTESYAPTVVEKMQESPNVPFAISSEMYGRIEQSNPELVSRLIADIGPADELTESVKDGLGTLAANFGVDVPDSIGEALPLVGEVVLGLKLIWSIVKTERELADVELPDRSRIHGVRVLALASRFGINQVCMLAGGAGGTAAGTVVPGVGNVAGGLGGALAGIGGAMMLNRRLEPRIEEVAMKLVGGDADDVFYLMNRVEIDQIGESLAATRAA